MPNPFTALLDVMHRGGPVMWVLLALNVISLTLILERIFFWVRTNSPAQQQRLGRINRLLRQGDLNGARVVGEEGGVYGRSAVRLVDEIHHTGTVNDAAATELVENLRNELDRFQPTLSTMITAGPLFGLLGTVIGLISTFAFLADKTGVDPRGVGIGLSEALLNTAAGLIVALVALFPYNAFKAQIDRTMGRIETLIASAQRAGTPVAKPDGHDAVPSHKPLQQVTSGR